MTGLLANQLTDKFKQIGLWFSSTTDDQWGDKLYVCFDKAAEKYCKNIQQSISGGIANLFIWHPENWDEIYNILDLTKADINIDKLNLNSICGNYKASYAMATLFVDHVKDEILKSRELYDEINRRKQSFETNETVKQIKFDLQELKKTITAPHTNQNFKDANLKVEIPKEELEVWATKIFESEHGLDWVEKNLFLSMQKLLLELTVNRFYYGQASKCTLKVRGKIFELIDDGDDFNTKHKFLKDTDNLDRKGGGFDYFNGFLIEHSNKMSVSYSRENHQSKLAFCFNDYDKLVRQHCSLNDNSNSRSFFDLPKELYFKEECDAYYLNVGEYKMLSITYRAIDVIRPQLPQGKRLFIHTTDGLERSILQRRFINDPWVIVEK
ncbi:hypothetical protein [Pseudoalteromonas piscicida]|uniref:Uncharacterized protein n=1 Tax=Pseudoalteromonas piscicida TaxID=43662 RepID=A0AAQ2EPM5_PSEO7|nr:hypothetical protein [Pseudoalteromonas piscicida]TMN72098.1 hypothetical protein CWB74_23110 [Pseudoalteromonas piscicida]